MTIIHLMFLMKIDYNEFRESFLPNVCNTVYKYQGGKIDEHYNIWDTHKMDIKEMYTSLSRTTKLKYIHLNNKKICKQYRERPIRTLMQIIKTERYIM